MQGMTHLAGGAVCGLLISSLTHASPAQTIAMTCCSTASALIPDIDICTSKLGRKIGPASFLIQLFIGHRTLFHAPLPYIALLGILSHYFPQNNFMWLAAAAGIFSHLLLDMGNPSGIPLLWPAQRRFSFASVQTRGLVDWLIGLSLTFIAAFFRYRNHFL